MWKVLSSTKRRFSARAVMTENRFGNLIRSKPDRAKELQESLGTGISRRMHRMQRSSMDDFELLDVLKKVRILRLT